MWLRPFITAGLATRGSGVCDAVVMVKNKQGAKAMRTAVKELVDRLEQHLPRALAAGSLQPQHRGISSQRVLMRANHWRSECKLSSELSWAPRRPNRNRKGTTVRGW